MRQIIVLTSLGKVVGEQGPKKMDNYQIEKWGAKNDKKFTIYVYIWKLQLSTLGHKRLYTFVQACRRHLAQFRDDNNDFSKLIMANKLLSWTRVLLAPLLESPLFLGTAASTRMCSILHVRRVQWRATWEHGRNAARKRRRSDGSVKSTIHLDLNN